jgi:hypothetical protein
LIKDKSYAYVDCNNKEIRPYEVSTLNLADYLDDLNFNELKTICSYDKCYEIKEGILQYSINNFKKIYDKTLNEDELYEVNVKGYPITKIVVDAC